MSRVRPVGGGGNKLATAGALIPDDNLDDYLRDIGGLPTEEEAEVA